MFKKLRVLLAFLVSPIFAIVVIQFFKMAWIIWPVGISFEKIFFGIFIGIGPMIIFYILMVVISIPIFLLVKYFFWWDIRTCIVSSLIITVTSFILFFTGEPLTGEESYLQYSILAGAMVGSVIYGIIFWRVVSGSYKAMDK